MSSDSSHQSSVIAADPSRPFTPRLLIADLLRTRYCTPGTVLLVESIDAHIPVSKRYRTIRLLLGDGELCIQALLRPEMHRFVDSGQVFVGGYVQLTRFEIKSIQVEAGNGAVDTEEMVFLVVRDVATVGWNAAFMQMAGTTGQEPQNKPMEPKPQMQNSKGKKVIWKDQQPADSPVKQGNSSASVGKGKDNNENEMTGAKDMAEDETDEPIRGAGALQERTTASRSSYPASNNLPWISDDLSKPLKLTPLKSVPNLPYKQNWIVNVLAVVVSLSEVEPASLPPYKQRTARLADASTSKHVHLTVFLDADNFAPEVGSVVLLLSVKNHRFDGGSLKKYGNEKLKDGSRWWFENPSHIEWCDVAGLRRWWDERSSCHSGLKSQV